MEGFSAPLVRLNSLSTNPKNQSNSQVVVVFVLLMMDDFSLLEKENSTNRKEIQA